MKKELLLIIFILSSCCCAGQTKASRALSDTERIYFEIHKPKLPEWDTLAQYFCTDLCMMCGCKTQYDYYENDSAVYCFNRLALSQDGGDQFCYVLKFDRVTKKIILYDRVAEKTVAVSEYRKYLREHLKNIPRIK